MALLRLPLELPSSGVLERAGAEDDTIGDRLRLFLLSGMGEYLRLPSPGIRAVWVHLYTMGTGGRMRDQIPEEERKVLERTITEEVNHWLEGVAHIAGVSVLGDGTEPNGISFATDTMQYSFSFSFALRGRGLAPDAAGCWNIGEERHAIH